MTDGIAATRLARALELLELFRPKESDAPCPQCNGRGFTGEWSKEAIEAEKLTTQLREAKGHDRRLDRLGHEQ